MKLSIALLSPLPFFYAEHARSQTPLPDSAHPLHRPNVLFVAVDDLNHWVGCLGRNAQTKTPAIDALAERGTVFVNAHCPAPLCNPSRAAILTGMRPGRTGVYENAHDWRTVVPKDKTMPGVFGAAGYRTVGVGKIYDYKYPRPEDFDTYATRKEIGSFPPPKPEDKQEFGEPAYAPLDCDDEDTPEYKMVSYALKELDAQAAKGAEAPPLFLAVGLFKPHAPWFVPRKYFDMHPVEKIPLPPFKEDDLDDLPASALRMAKEPSYGKIMAAGKWSETMQGYMAAVSYADAQLQRLFGGLDKHPQLRENTIIVLWGDNGWHFGEKHHFGKYTLWEEATRVPYIWVVPRLAKAGSRCEATVDLMSVFPTLLALCGIKKPVHVEGENIFPLLENAGATWDKPAISTYKQDNHSIRKCTWRYTSYANGDEELYDHANDPYEWENLARRGDAQTIRTMLKKCLPRENEKALPASEYWKNRFGLESAKKTQSK
jgi:arylsulfatase A-like enzyme